MSDQWYIDIRTDKRGEDYEQWRKEKIDQYFAEQNLRNASNVEEQVDRKQRDREMAILTFVLGLPVILALLLSML